MPRLRPVMLFMKIEVLFRGKTRARHSAKCQECLIGANSRSMRNVSFAWCPFQTRIWWPHSPVTNVITFTASVSRSGARTIMIARCAKKCSTRSFLKKRWQTGTASSYKTQVSMSMVRAMQTTWWTDLKQVATMMLIKTCFDKLSENFDWEFT